MSALTTDTIESLIARIRLAVESLRELDPNYPEPSRDKRTWNFAINCFIGILESQQKVSESMEWALKSPLRTDYSDIAAPNTTDTHTLNAMAITDCPSEWIPVVCVTGHSIWQSRKVPELFSVDKGVTYYHTANRGLSFVSIKSCGHNRSEAKLS